MAALDFIQYANSGAEAQDPVATFGGAVIGGNTIVALVGTDPARTISDVTDNKGNTYTEVVEQGGNKKAAIWVSSNVTGGGGFAVTADITHGTGDWGFLGIVEFEGNLVEDDSSGNDDAVKNTSQDCGSVTTTVNDTVVVTVSRCSTDPGGGTPAANYTELGEHGNRMYDEYRILASTSVGENPIWTSVNNINSTNCIAAFKEVSVGTNMDINIGDFWKDVT